MNGVHLTGRMFKIFSEMKIADTKIKKAILIITGFILLMVAVVILFASPIGKYLSKKYGGNIQGVRSKWGWFT
jgi:hypothetical protein